MNRGNYILGKLVMLKYRNSKIHNGPQTLLQDEEYKENENQRIKQNYSLEKVTAFPLGGQVNYKCPHKAISETTLPRQQHIKGL